MVFVSATAELTIKIASRAERQHAKKHADICFQLNLNCAVNPIVS